MSLLKKMNFNYRGTVIKYYNSAKEETESDVAAGQLSLSWWDSWVH